MMSCKNKTTSFYLALQAEYDTMSDDGRGGTTPHCISGLCAVLCSRYPNTECHTVCPMGGVWQYMKVSGSGASFTSVCVFGRCLVLPQILFPILSFLLVGILWGLCGSHTERANMFVFLHVVP